MENKRIRKKIRQITRKDFVPAVLLLILITSITWGARLIGEGGEAVSKPIKPRARTADNKCK